MGIKIITKNCEMMSDISKFDKNINCHNFENESKLLDELKENGTVVVLGMEAHKGTKQKIIAEAPMSETFKYANELKAITQGRGYFEMKLVRYEELMGDLAQKVIEKRKNSN